MRCRDCGAEVSDYDISCEVCGCIDFVDDVVLEREEANSFNPIPPVSVPKPPPQPRFTDMSSVATPPPMQGQPVQPVQVQPMQTPPVQPVQVQPMQTPPVQPVQVQPMQGQTMGYVGQQPTYIVMQPQVPVQTQEQPQAPAPVAPVAPALAPVAQDGQYKKRKTMRILKNILWYSAVLGVAYYVVFVYLGYTPDGLWGMLTGEATRVAPALSFQDGGL